MTNTRQTDWRTLIVQADPDHTRTSNNPVEYEFSAKNGGNDLTHEGTIRIFRGQYKTRGPYNE